MKHSTRQHRKSAWKRAGGNLITSLRHMLSIDLPTTTSSTATATKTTTATTTTLSIVLFLALMPLSIKPAEAGGKGKVPVYMPIPIPIPMPVGPPPPPPPGAHHHGGMRFFQQQHHHQHEANGHDDDGEGEVKKIYLLQPMPRLQPQPQLKGGGFMGPVQNHIHVNQQDHAVSHSPGRFRHSGGGGGGGKGHAHSQHQHQQHVSNDGDLGEPQVATKSHSAAGIKSAASNEVKILPIVVIPPMAPMPPIQVQPSGGSAAGGSTTTSSTHRLMFSPQFNNFLVAGASQSQSSERTKRHHRQLHQMRASDTLSDYGGSIGGSFFRENFAARSRPHRAGGGGSGRAASMMLASSDLHGDTGRPFHQGRSARSRDYDYADYGLDYDSGGGGGGPQASDYSPAPLVRRRQYRLNQGGGGGGAYLQRRYQRPSHYGGGGGEQRVKSIRDILEQQKAARFEDYDQLVNNDQQVDYSNSDASDAPPLEQRLRNYQQAELDENQLIQQQQQQQQQRRNSQQASGAGGFEISLDDLANQLAAADSNQQSRPVQVRAGGQDLSSLYYERGDLASGSDRSSSRVAPRAGGSRASGGGGELFDDDEWRFDSVKSVRHVAAATNETMTTPANSHTSAANAKPSAATPLGSLRLIDNNNNNGAMAANQTTPTSRDADQSG